MESTIDKIELRARNLFTTRQLTCSEAVFSVINGALDGGLSDPMAIRIASGLSEGMSGGGCACGALSGGIIAIGLFLGRRGPGLRNGRQVAAASRKLHDAFSNEFGSSCCRILMKRLRRGSGDHYRECGRKTALTARIVAGLILEERPELLDSVNHGWLDRIDSRLDGCINRISGKVPSSRHG